MVASIDRLPPHNLEAEQSMLGSLLIDRDAIIRVAAALKADDFYSSANGAIFQAIVDLYNKREPTDLVTLTDELNRRDRLNQVGGVAAGLRRLVARASKKRFAKTMSRRSRHARLANELLASSVATPSVTSP